MSYPKHPSEKQCKAGSSVKKLRQSLRGRLLNMLKSIVYFSAPTFETTTGPEFLAMNIISLE